MFETKTLNIFYFYKQNNVFKTTKCFTIEYKMAIENIVDNNTILWIKQKINKLNKMYILRSNSKTL